MGQVVRGTLRLLVLALCVTAPVLGAGGCDNRRQEIISSIRRLSAALEEKNGEAAASLYSRATVEYYDRIVRLGREAKRDQIAKMTPLERIEILRMRNRSSLAELKPLDGLGYIKLAVSRGWWVHNFERIPDDVDLSDVKIKISSSSAWLDLELDSDNMPGLSRVLENADRKRYLRLFKEDGGWRLDVTAMHDLLNELLTKAVDGYHTGDRDSVYIGWEEAKSGKPVSPAIWDPPRR